MAVCLVVVLTLALFVQSPAFAKEADEGRSISTRERVVVPSRGSVVGKTAEPGVANPEGSQPRPGEDAREFRLRKEKETASQRDRDRREIVREVTGERHIPGGGPQE